MAFWNRKKSEIKETSNESSGDEFTFFALKDEVLEQYGLPKQPCPVRLSILENVFSKGALEFAILADECNTYYCQHPENQADIKPLLVRLCYIAGVNAGQAGDNLKALQYLAKAYDTDPHDFQAAANYALALSKSGRFDESLEIYEQILSFLQDGKRGFSPQVWTEAVKIHNMKGNFVRALELVEISIKKAPQYFGDDAKAFAQELRSKIQNG